MIALGGLRLRTKQRGKDFFVLETLEIKLTDQTVARLEAAAERLGLTPAQLLEISLEEKLSMLDKDWRYSR